MKTYSRCIRKDVLSRSEQYSGYKILYDGTGEGV